MAIIIFGKNLFEVCFDILAQARSDLLPTSQGGTESFGFTVWDLFGCPSLWFNY